MACLQPAHRLLCALTGALMVLAAQAQDESKIIGGTVVDISKSPFLVSPAVGLARCVQEVYKPAAFEERNNSTAPFFQQCGSVIIDQQYIITAGHCFLTIADDLKITRPPSSMFRIRVGTSQLEKGGTIYSVSKYWVHPKFKVTKTKAGTTLDYDIGVARLAKPIVFGASVGKASLIGVNQHLAAGTKAIAVGWGVTTYTGSASALLRRAIFSVVEQPECNRQYGQRLKESVTERFFCTKAASKGDCFGDSGGPVFNRTGSVVAGIISWGTCYVMPNVVTNLGNTEIRSFIRETSKLNV